MIKNPSHLDLILINANIFTFDSQYPKASWMGIQGKRIHSIGDKDDWKLLWQQKTEIIDCKGKAILPGFIDAHLHFISYAETLVTLNLRPSSGVQSISDIQSRIRTYSKTITPGGWIRGKGYDEFAIAEKRHPNRWDLDMAATNHPVKLTHRSSHAHVLNSLALKKVGITRETEDPPGGIIERDLESGEPTGLLYEMGHFLTQRIPALPIQEMEQGVRMANEALLSNGITSFHDASVLNDLERWQLFKKWKESGMLLPRITMMLGSSPSLLKTLSAHTMTPAKAGDQIPLKILDSGLRRNDDKGLRLSIEEMISTTLSPNSSNKSKPPPPYPLPRGEGERRSENGSYDLPYPLPREEGEAGKPENGSYDLPYPLPRREREFFSDHDLRLYGVKIILDETTGRLCPSQNELDEMVLEIHKTGWPVAIHAIEKNAIESAYTAIKHALDRIPGKDHGHRVEHCSVCPPDLAGRIAEQRIMVVTQPSFIYYSGDRYLLNVPKNSLPNLYPVKTLLSKGVLVAGSSDCPIVPPNPFMGIYAAVTRMSESGHEVSPGQGISLIEAFKLYTVNSAQAIGEEKHRGSITPGKLADLVILNKNPFSLSTNGIKHLKIEMTILNGKIVWEKKDRLID